MKMRSPVYLQGPVNLTQRLCSVVRTLVTRQLTPGLQLQWLVVTPMSGFAAVHVTSPRKALGTRVGAVSPTFMFVLVENKADHMAVFLFMEILNGCPTKCPN